MIALSTASALRFYVPICGCFCVVERANLCCPWLLTRTAAVQTSAPGSRPDSGRMQEVSWMKYDLNAYAEMGNITLEAYSICLRALKIQRFITHQLWCIWENFNVYRRGLSRRHDVCINITQPSLLFFPLNSACRIDNRGLICLPRLLSGSTAKQRVNCVSVFCGILSNLKDWGNQCFFHFQSGDVALTIDLWLSEWCH